MCRPVAINSSHLLLLSFLFITSMWQAETKEADSTSADVAKLSNRTGRNFEDSLIYRQQEPIDVPTFSNVDPNPTKSENVAAASSKYRPPYTGPMAFDEHTPRSLPRYYSNSNGGRRFGYYRPKPDILTASSSNTDWNTWNDDADDSKDSEKPSAPEFHHIHKFDQPWKGDPWKADPWNNGALMMIDAIKGANGGVSEKNSFLGSLFDKFSSDPMALLVAGLLPLTLIIAAVLPTIVNMMMTGQGIPTFTTTATGNNGRSFDNGTEFLNPVLDAIAEFGVKSLDDPHCMQKIFCQVTKAGDNSGTNIIQKTLYTASILVDDSWLETMGLKMLFDSMEDGNCEKIPCSSSKEVSDDKNP